MKLVIFFIALISLSTAAAAVSPTTSLAKVMSSEAQTAAAAAATALTAAAGKLTAAQSARATAQVLTTTWTALTTAKAAVTTKRGDKKTQDTALEALVTAQTDAMATSAGAQVDNACQVMTAAMRANWKIMAGTYLVTATDYTDPETAFVEPKQTDFDPLATKLKAAVDALDSAITAGMAVGTVTNCPVAQGAACTNDAVSKNAGAWDPTRTWDVTALTGNLITVSYQSLNCPYPGTAGNADTSKIGSPVCSDCTLVAGKSNVPIFTTALQNTATSMTCTWDQMMNRAQQVNVMMTKMKLLYEAKGYTAGLVAMTALLTGVDKVDTSTTAYQAQLDASATVMTNFMVQVDSVAKLLMQMRQTQAVALANTVLLQVVTTQNKAKAQLLSDAAGTAWTNAKALLTGNTGLTQKATDARAAVAAQWTVVNDSVGASADSMVLYDTTVNAVGVANAALQGALTASGKAAQLYTSSQATDAKNTADQTNLQALTALSKTDYDNVVAMQKAGSSMIQVSLLSGFAILLAYIKF